MLAGLAGLAVPIIIHLIFQQRFPTIRFSTTRFFDRAEVANVVSVRLVHILQLLLRLGVVLLFVLAMTRPFLSFVGERLSSDIVVVLDNSFYSELRAGEMTALERAKELVTKLLKQCGGNDKVGVVLVGDGRTYQLRSAEKQLGIVRDVRVVGAKMGGLARALSRAIGMLSNQKEANKFVVVLSTFPSASFDAVRDAEAVARYKKIARRIRKGLRTYFVDVGPEELSDVGVVDCIAGQESVFVGVPAKFTAVLKNYGRKEADVKVRFFAGTSLVDERRVEVPGGGRVLVDLAHSFGSPQSTPCRFELGGDDLRFNDQFYFGVSVGEPVRVLLVDGSKGKEKGSEFLAYALSPGAFLGEETRSGIEVIRTQAGKFGSEILINYAVIVLYSVDSLPSEQLRDLSEFVKQGGGLLIVPGEGVDMVRFNESFSRDGKILPARFVGVSELEPYESLVVSAGWHPLCRPYRESHFEDISAVVVKKLVKLETLEGAEKLFETEKSAPVVLEKKYGRGRVIVCGMDFLPNYSNLVVSELFVSFSQRLVRYLAGAEGRGMESLRVGQSYEQSFSPNVSEVVVVRPDGVKQKVGMEEGRLLYSETNRVGIYSVQVVGANVLRQRFFGVNLPEMNLTRMDPSMPIKLYGEFAPEMVRAEGLQLNYRKGTELWRILGFLAFLLFAVEAFSAWYQTKRG